MKLTGKQKAHLKKEAHHLQPIFQIGKIGLTEETFRQIEDALEKRELIKIHLLQGTIIIYTKKFMKLKTLKFNAVIMKL